MHINDDFFSITGQDIAKVFLESLEHYGIERKIGGITVDNAANNTTFIKELKELLKKKNIDFDVEDSHFKCFPHILNLCVQDVLQLLNCDANVEQIQENENSEAEENIEDSAEAEGSGGEEEDDFF